MANKKSKRQKKATHTQSIGIEISSTCHCMTWTHQAVWPENEASVVPKALVSARKMVGTL